MANWKRENTKSPSKKQSNPIAKSLSLEPLEPRLLLAAYSGGAGTELSPYQISTLADWQTLTNTANSADWDNYFVLTANLDFGGAALTPVAPDTNNITPGFNGIAFTGGLDGAGYVISNAVISQPNSDYVGLFGKLDIDGQIQNLGLENVDINGRKYVGGLTGENVGDITDCYATGAVSGIGSYTYFVGGLAGTNSGVITSSYAAGAVAGTTNIGGLAGTNSGSIISSYATGAVSGTDHVGGLAGINSSDISFSYSTGAVSGSYDVGGLTGDNYGVITSGVWDVQTSGKTYSAGGKGLTTLQLKTVSILQNAGWANHGWVMENGLDYPRLAWEATGYAAIPEAGPLPLAGSGTAESPYQIATAEDFALLSWHTGILDQHLELKADIDLSGVELDPIGELGDFSGVFDGAGFILHHAVISRPNNDYVGLFSYLDVGGQITNLGMEDINISGRNYVGGVVGYNAGDITNSYAAGTVSGDDTVGGLVGFNSGPVTSCFAPVTVSGEEHVGGLAGYNDSGAITSSYATGAVSGTISVGGLIGWNYGDVTASYAAGAVSGTDDIGGLIGFNYFSNIISCVWNTQTSGQAGSSGGKGLTTPQMKTMSVFQNAGWSDYDWDMKDGLDYPRLAWQNTGGANIPAEVIPLSGSGTQADPYLINTPADFALLSWHVGILNQHLQLSGDINLTGAELDPIGDLGNFSGVFDGAGYVIRNAVINQPDSDFVGLFSRIDTGGQIHHVGVENIDITGRNYVGGLAGDHSGAITTCYVMGQVSGEDYVGGLVGRNYEGTITTGYSTSAVSGSFSPGGLVGSNNSGTITSSFWDTQTSGQTTSAGGEGKTTAQMQTQSTFTSAGWDFSADDGDLAEWQMTPGDYPRLMSATSVIAPEIMVRGNNVVIVDGDSTPGSSDATSFGSVTKDAAAVSRTYTVYNTGSLPLTLGSVAVPSGYTMTEPLNSSIPAGGNDSFTVRLNTGTIGTFAGDIQFTTNDGDENPFNFRISGTITDSTPPPPPPPPPPPTSPEIDVRGNGSSITDGDSTPNTSDGTDFGSVAKDSAAVSRTFTVFYTGDAVLSLGSVSLPTGYTLTESLSSSIAAGSSDSFTVQLNTASAGTFAGDISFSNNDGNENPYNFRITGIVVGAMPEIEVRGNSIVIVDGDSTPNVADATDFGSAMQNSTALSRTFTVYNTGTAALTISSMTLPSGYTLSENLNSSIAAGGSDAFTVQLNTANTGTFAGDIRFTTNDGDENPFNFRITGKITTPEVEVRGNGVKIADGDSTPDDVDGTNFGSASFTGTAISRTFTVNNVGDNVLTIGSLTLPSGFTVTEPLNESIAAGESDSFTVELSTAAAGAFNGDISFTIQAGSENPFNFQIAGIVIAPDIEVQGDGVVIMDGDNSPDIADGTDFGNVNVKIDSLNQIFTISNLGTATLNLTGTSYVIISGTHAGDFTVVDQPNAAIAANGGTATFEIKFNPRGVGLRTAVVTIPSDDPDENPYEFQIEGTGLATAVPFSGSITYTEGDGTKVNLRLMGGTGTAWLAGNNVTTKTGSGVVVSGSDLELVRLELPGGGRGPMIMISASGGDGKAQLGDIAGQSIGMLMGRSAELLGDMTLTGSLGMMMFGNILDGASITTAQAGSTMIMAGDIGDATLDIAGKVSMMMVNSFTAGSLTADEIGMVMPKSGVFGADLTARTGKIGMIMAKGDVTGNLNAATEIGMVMARGADITGLWRAGQKIGMVMADSFDGAILSSGGDVGMVMLGKDMVDTHLLAGYDIGNDLIFGAGDQIRSGNVGMMMVSGTFGSSYVGAGVLPASSLTSFLPEAGQAGDNVTGKIGMVRFGKIDTEAAQPFGLYAATAISGKLQDQGAFQVRILEQ